MRSFSLIVRSLVFFDDLPVIISYRKEEGHNPSTQRFLFIAPEYWYVFRARYYNGFIVVYPIDYENEEIGCQRELARGELLSGRVVRLRDSGRVIPTLLQVVLDVTYQAQEVDQCLLKPSKDDCVISVYETDDKREVFH